MMLSSGGVLKDALKTEITNEDLINTNLEDDKSDTDDRRLVFKYKKSKHKYLYQSKYNK